MQSFEQYSAKRVYLKSDVKTAFDAVEEFIAEKFSSRVTGNIAHRASDGNLVTTFAWNNVKILILTTDLGSVGWSVEPMMEIRE